MGFFRDFSEIFINKLFQKLIGVGPLDEEIGRIKKSETTELVVRMTEFRGSVGIDIREYVTSDRYTGWSKNGIRIPVDEWAHFKEVLENVTVPKGVESD